MVTTIRNLPLNALRIFDAAARHLSFAAAASELGVTAAAVSVQVRRLEEWVGVPLFVRGHRTITLSTAGRTLAPQPRGHGAHARAGRSRDVPVAQSGDLA